MSLFDWLVEVVLIVFGIAGYIHSGSFAPWSEMMFPRFVFILIIALSVLQLILNVRSKQEKENPMEGVDYHRMLSMVFLICATRFRLSLLGM